MTKTPAKQLAKWRRYYRRNHAEMLRKKKEQRLSRIAYVNSFKTCCLMCGNADPRVIDFHHVEKKISSVAELKTNSASRAKIAAEIAKCIQLCANCHRIHHWTENNDATGG